MNESLVLLSDCLQMMPVTIAQRTADPATTKIAHGSPLLRASLPSTATMHKVMIRIAKRERNKRGTVKPVLKFPQVPSFSPKLVQREPPFLWH